ncbi:MAG: hypothetical protein IPF65_12990 [Polaromonas sp.]|nr:hypothetical protein [Polaromonas sp.]MBK7501740.1 hypothetical protein [Polaromonas sp.]MBP6088017.1 hypothetical protein [Polaromonas sp.]MBP6141965.1 hypothetical protein [Polaromonas sp.]MBP6155796.1 hypothetical protein [Polaromonas sp.]
MATPNYGFEKRQKELAKKKKKEEKLKQKSERKSGDTVDTPSDSEPHSDGPGDSATQTP